jgi:hypothetical protein
MSKILLPALRQYRHNAKEDFVFGYAMQETNTIVRELQEQLEQAMCLVNQLAHVGIDFGYGEFYITNDAISKARTLSSDYNTEGLKDD